MSETPSRRQSRGNQQKSYRVDDDYSFLDDEDGGPGASGVRMSFDSDDEEDADDFMPDVVDEEPDDEFEEDVEEEEEVETGDDRSDGEAPSTPGSKLASATSTPSKPPAAMSSERKSNINTPTRKTAAKRLIPGTYLTQSAADENLLRARGVADFTKAGGQEARLRDLYGQRNQDLKPILLTREHWLQQQTFPLRKEGSLRRSFHEEPGAFDLESENAREWYTEIGREMFSRLQKSRVLSADSARPYLQNSAPGSLNVLIGPINTSEVRTLEQRSYMNVAEPYKRRENRRGWLFNLGSRVQDAQWAIKEDGIQYLAVAVEQHPADGQQPAHLENPEAPAFTPTKPYPASIQVWAFDLRTDSADTLKEPYLAAVLCTEWGAPKQIRWCPGIASDKHLGLLAGIWSDGHLRLLEVAMPEENTSSTQYIHISQAGFDIVFPQTVPSCIHWLSSTTIGAATAAGTIAIWALDTMEPLPSSVTKPCAPRPFFYKQVADTYILTLSSGCVSQPYFFCITTADGFAKLYDLRCPHIDNTTSIRGRTLCITAAWHEQTLTFIMPDEHYMLKHNPIRRFYHNLYTMRAESSITRVASSPVHPCVLIGGADGRVEASNPLGRILNYKIIPWQQTWFMHEWRRPVDELVPKVAGRNVETGEGSAGAGAASDPAQPETTSNEVPESVLTQPLVRITEGYKASQPGIAHSIMSKKPANPEVGKGMTIYEEQSAISVLAWNPNLKFGLWAVAGMASGLLRVEDVGV